MPLDRPNTFIGAKRLYVVTSPISPEKLLPQHFTPPASVTAQEWLPPKLIDWMFDNNGGMDAARFSLRGTNALADWALLKLRTIASAANIPKMDLKRVFMDFSLVECNQLTVCNNR